MEEYCLENLIDDLILVLANFVLIRDYVSLKLTCRRFFYLLDSEIEGKKRLFIWWQKKNYDSMFKLTLPKLEKIISEAIQKWNWSWRLIAHCIEHPELDNGYSVYLQKTKNFLPNSSEIIEHQLYIGSIVQGKIQGKSFLFMECGHNYIGEIFDGLLHGTGHFRWVEGDEYIGGYAKGIRKGYGVYRFKNGAEYSGNFRNGKSSGFGIYKDQDGGIYKGSYELDNRHGRGIYIWPNGTRLEGNFNRNMVHGYGKISFVNGKTFCCVFHEDVPRDPRDQIHPKIASIFEKGQCATNITKKEPYYWQFLYRCKTCNDKRWYCHTCRECCHIENHQWKRTWIAGTGYCQCFETGNCKRILKSNLDSMETTQ